MARKASGLELVEQAQALLSSASTVEEFRQAQALLLPLELGLSMAQTARSIGVSRGWACQLRRRLIAADGKLLADRPRPGGRRRQNMTLVEEAAFLSPFFEQAQSGGILVVADIKQALDQRLGRSVALASAYNLLHRHGWHKLAADKRQPKVDIAAKDSKKDSVTAASKPKQTARTAANSANN